jgi:DNA helicase-2/ATP-dependent DNA helicase PcrA
MNFVAVVGLFTFSTQAASEAARRLNNTSSVDARTIHSFGYKIIKRFWHLMGEGLPPDILSPEIETELYDRFNIPAICRKDFAVIQAANLPPSELESLIRKGFKVSGITLSAVDQYKIFSKLALQEGYLTFDQILLYTNELVQFNEVQEYLKDTYSHLLIDEAQDTSLRQWQIFKVLLRSVESITVVGDINQSIYSFIGADGTLLLSLAEINKVATFKLTKSFRSTDSIAKFANKVIEDPTSIIQTEKVGTSIVVRRFLTKKEEIDYIVNRSKDLEGTVGILARTNFYLYDVELALLANGVEFNGTTLTHTSTFKSIWAIIHELEDNVATTVLEQVYIKNRAIDATARTIAQQVNDFIKDNGMAPLRRVQNNIFEEHKVTVSTGHSSKGLEWDHVLLAGSSDGVIPHPKSCDLQEEKNLFYVMSTRARDSLEILYVGRPSILIPEEYLR